MSSGQADFYTAATTQPKDQDKVNSDLNLAVSPQDDKEWHNAISAFEAVKRLPAEEQHLHERGLELGDLERRAQGLPPLRRNIGKKRGGPEPLWKGREEGPEAPDRSLTGISGTDTRDFAFTGEPGSKSSVAGLTEQEMREAADRAFEQEQNECRQALTATNSSGDSTKPQSSCGDAPIPQDNRDLYSDD